MAIHLHYTPGQIAFREEVRAWMQANVPVEPLQTLESEAGFIQHREWERTLARDNWGMITWPRDYGGRGASLIEWLIFEEEYYRANAPARVNQNGLFLLGPTLMEFGTAAHRARFLPSMAAGEEIWAQAWSEPQAGSDLAALRTSATRDGDHWVINGQKIWTTTWWGKYMFLAARTDKDAKPPHAGISMFIVPMDAEGITIRPSTTMYDGSFANIFYDNVRIPLDSIIGEVNGGWKVLTGALAFERGLIGGGIVLKVAHAFEQLRRHVIARDGDVSPLSEDPIVRERIAVLAAEIEVGRQLMMQCAELASGGITPPEYGAISKVFSGELMERFGEAALDILGMRATLSEGMRDAIDNGRFEQNLRHSLMWVISIGTNEIQRSLIAQRGLGLPR